MRQLHMGMPGGKFLALPISDEDAVALCRRKLLYDCGDGHDLHLDPKGGWKDEEVEALVIALARGRAVDTN